MWVAASRIGGRRCSFLSTLILARLLGPEDFGVAGYAVTLIVLLGSLPELGLGPALIHHREDRETLDTGFWLGLLGGAWRSRWSGSSRRSRRGSSVTTAPSL